MFLTFSRTAPSRIYKAWIFFDPFPCYLHHIAFDRLKSRTPFPCPASQLMYIFLKFQCVFCVLNFSVANTIINEESYFRINVESMSVEISLMYKENNKGPRTVPCGTRLNPIFLRLQQLAVVCSTEKNLSISVSSHLCHSQTVCSSGAHTVGCQMLFSKSKMNVSTLPPLSKTLDQSFITVVS